MDQQTSKPQYLNNLPSTGFLRICHIVGDKKQDIPALLPIGKTSFLNGVKSGKFPHPVNLGPRTVAWRVEDILNVIESMGQK